MCKPINIDELTLEFCKKNSDKINWSRINNSKTQLSDKFMRTFQHYLDWRCLSYYQDIPVDLVKLYKNQLNWEKMLKRNRLPQSILILCPEHYWSYLYEYQILSEKFLIALVTIDNLTEDDWNDISEYQQLSPSFMRTYADKLNWKLLSQYQILPEKLIEEFADRVDWHDIMMFQTLTEDFSKIHNFNDLWKAIIQFKWKPEDEQEQRELKNMLKIYDLAHWNKWRNRSKPDYSKYIKCLSTLK